MGWETEHTRGPGCLFQVGAASEILICSVPAQSPKRKEAWGYCWHGTKLFPWRSSCFKALKHSGYKHKLWWHGKLGVGVGGGKCYCWAVAHQPNPSTSPSLKFPYTTCSMWLEEDRWDKQRHCAQRPARGGMSSSSPTWLLESIWPYL